MNYNDAYKLRTHKRVNRQKEICVYRCELTHTSNTCPNNIVSAHSGCSLFSYYLLLYNINLINLNSLNTGTLQTQLNRGSYLKTYITKTENYLMYLPKIFLLCKNILSNKTRSINSIVKHNFLTYKDVNRERENGAGNLSEVGGAGWVLSLAHRLTLNREEEEREEEDKNIANPCLLYTSPSPRDKRQSRMPSSA